MGCWRPCVFGFWGMPSSRSSAPHFPGSVAVSPSQSWRAGSSFSQDGVCSVPSDWCCIKATQAWKRFLQHPQRHSIPRVIQGVWGAEPIIPELLTLQPLWARTAISFLGACFTVKPLIVRPFLWWGEFLPLCEQIHWYFHQGLWKTGNYRDTVPW